MDFSGRGELADRQQKLAQMLSRLQKISEGTYTCTCTCVLLHVQYMYIHDNDTCTNVH